jgi:hypothetical protein
MVLYMKLLSPFPNSPQIDVLVLQYFPSNHFSPCFFNSITVAQSPLPLEGRKVLVRVRFFVRENEWRWRRF